MTAHGALKPNVKAASGVKLEVEEGQGDGKFDPQYEDLDELDDYEHKLFEGTVVFTQPDGSDEPGPVTVLRFTLSDNMLLSLPHHKHKLKTWVEGGHTRHSRNSPYCSSTLQRSNAIELRQVPCGEGHRRSA